MKSITIIFMLILALSGISNGQTPDSLKFKSLPPIEFEIQYSKCQKGILIDVREFFEFKKIRIKNAINMPSSGNLQHPSDTISKTNSLFFYCTSGFRSKRVAKFFYEKGFTNLYSLDGGIVAWRKEKLPVDRKKVRRK